MLMATGAAFDEECAAFGKLRIVELRRPRLLLFDS